VATRGAFEEVVAGPGPTGAVEPRPDLVVVGDGHPRIGCERLATDGNLVDADSFEFFDDAGSRSKLAPSRLRMAVERARRRSLSSVWLARRGTSVRRQSGRDT